MSLALIAPVLLAQAVPASMAVADIDRVVELAEPVFLPDGSAVVYSATVADPKADTRTSDLWRSEWTDGKRRNLTRTPGKSEWLPQASSDGKRIYFLADTAKDDTTQLWTIAATGGARRQVTRLPGGITDFALAPDGKRAVVVAERGSSVGVSGTPPPVVIDRYQAKQDYRGRIDDRVAQLFLVDLKNGKASQLTNGRFDVATPSWSPDGLSIAYVSWQDEAADRRGDSDVFVIAPEPGAQPRAVSPSRNADNDPNSTPMRPAWSPDSRKLAWVTGGESRWIYYAPHQLTVLDLASGAATTPARIDRWFYQPRWSADGSAVLALVEQDRDTWLARIDPASDRIDYLTQGARFATDFAVGPHGRIAVLDGTVERPAALRSVEASPRVLADHNGWLADKVLVRPEDVSFRSADGTEIHGLFTPPLPGSVADGSKPPLVVRVHGGPVYQFSHEFMADWQVLAAKGYAVLAVNPRGSSGRGFDFARAIYADWGNKDVADLRAGIDHVLARGLADPDRIGIGGWSYGGILTNYMIASEPRLKAAVSGAGASYFPGLWGVDQYISEYDHELGKPWENPEGWAKVSYPFLKPQTIRTPTLFLCAEQDANVPCAGSEQMYQVLKSRDVPTRLVVYPGENHGLSVPSYTTDRLQRTIDWYDRYLKGN